MNSLKKLGISLSLLFLFLLNWHHKYLCDILQEEANRINENRPKTKDIVINIPFRSTKSILVTVMFPVWTWIMNPKLRFITASYSADLSIEHATRSRDIITSDWFKDRWGDIFHIKKDQNLKSRYENNFMGGKESNISRRYRYRARRGLSTCG